MKLAITTDAISQDFETAVILSLEWGIDCFEFKRIHHKRVPDVTPAEVKIVREVVKRKVVEICSVAPGCKVPLDRDRVAAEQKRLEASFNLAEELGVRKLVIFGFEKDSLRSRDEALAQVVDHLGQAASRAVARGCLLCVENERGHWVENPRDLAWVMAKVNSPALRVNWDPGNTIGTDAAAPQAGGYAQVRDWVAHVHVKDLRSPSPGQHVNVMVGEGEVDWRAQFASLIRDDYRECLVVEPHFGCRIASSRTHVVQTRQLLREAAAQQEGAQ